MLFKDIFFVFAMALSVVVLLMNMTMLTGILIIIPWFIGGFMVEHFKYLNKKIDSLALMLDEHELGNPMLEVPGK